MMNNKPDWLLDHTSNTYSQTGEDGVIEKILSTIGQNDKWCVEFGAWDGLYLSNVRRLVKKQDYSAIMIEADPEKFQALKSNYSANSKVIPINAFVGFNKEDGLDQLLKGHAIPKNFDFLCIDVDGNDYHIWKAIEDYRPKAVCIEFNPTIPTEVHFVQKADPAVSQGNSLLALSELAKEKGYELVCVLQWNAFFVDKQYFPKFGIANNAPHILRKYTDMVTWLFSGYDGSIHLAGARELPWHGLILSEAQLQILPRIFRAYPGNYSKVRQVFYRMFTRLHKKMFGDPNKIT
jgi:hypothetical protein